MRALVLAFFFVSGICGLLYEVVWIRVAGTVIGNTTFAIGTVVGVFMGGLAVGAWAGGRAADRRSGGSLLRLYGLLEGGIAISAAAVPFLLTASEPVFKLLWNSVGEVTALYAALRVVLMGFVLVVPTTLMGATLPVLTRFLSDSSQAAASEAGRAYAINTFGGVAGTLASGLWLIPAFGLRATTWVAVALNLAIAAAALALARGKSGAVETALSPEPPPRRLALAVSALSGFASLVYEVAWTRSLVLSLGSTVYAFTLILTAFILGLAAGSALSSRLVHRAKDPETALAVLQALIGIVAVALLPYLGNLPLRMASVPHERYGDLLWTECGILALVVFIPTLLIGAVFPFTFRMASGSDRAVGRSVAAVYTWNTIGSIAGSLAASFALIPTLGLAVSLRLAATVNLAVAAVLLVRGAPRLRLSAAAPALLGLVVWLLPSWNEQVLASGAYLYGAEYAAAAKALHIDVETVLSRQSTIVARYWDAYGLTTVHKSNDGNLSIRVNGKADASTGTSDMPTQRTVGNLGMLHHPAPRRALVIGLGSGVTLGAVACHPVREVDCIEISPAGARAAEHFTAANGGILKDPRIRLRIGDGRNAVQFAKEPYDVIVSQPSNLWISGMSNLFTREFFAMASKRLTPDGVFCQWVQAYRMPLDDFRSILRTFFEVFPEGSFWEIFPGQDYILLGSPTSIRIPWAELEARLAAPGLKEHFDGLHVPGAAGLLGHYVAGAKDVRIAVATAPLLTDDQSTIEYSTSRAMFTFLQPRTISWVQELRRMKFDAADYPGAEVAAVEKSRDSRRRIAHVIGYEGEGHGAREVLELLTQETGGLGDDEPTREHFQKVAYNARMHARFLRDARRFDEAIRTLAAVPSASSHRADALFERANIAILARKDEEAARCFEEIRSQHPGSFAATCLEAQIAEKLKRPDDAVRLWRAAIAQRPDSESAFAHLGDALANQGRSDEARQACLKSLELDPQNALARQVLDKLGKH
jgi:spermidine synthase